jgi:hypothetical protein
LAAACDGVPLPNRITDSALGKAGKGTLLNCNKVPQSLA